MDASDEVRIRRAELLQAYRAAGQYSAKLALDQPDGEPTQRAILHNAKIRHSHLISAIIAFEEAVQKSNNQ